MELDIVPFSLVAADIEACRSQQNETGNRAGQDGSCKTRLIKINPFGAVSGCGGCLFNWVIDAKDLYVLEVMTCFSELL